VCCMPFQKTQRTLFHPLLDTQGRMMWQCTFEDEKSSCEFCSAHGTRCGPKIFAEKARYFHAKVDGSPDSVHSHIDAFPSQTSLQETIKSEAPQSYGSQVLNGGRIHYSNGRHPLALNLDGLHVPDQTQLPVGKNSLSFLSIDFMQDSFNLSTPSTAPFSSIPSHEEYAFPFDLQSGADDDATNNGTPFTPNFAPDQELLPLYTEPCDDEIFEMSGIDSRFDTPPPTQYGIEQHPSFATYMCIRRFA